MFCGALCARLGVSFVIFAGFLVAEDGLGCPSFELELVTMKLCASLIC